MAIIELEEVLHYLDQIGEASDETQAGANTVLSEIIPRAEKIVLRELGPGYTFEEYPTATQKRIHHSGGSFIELPPHDTVAGITAVRYGTADATVVPTTDYYVEGNTLYRTGSLAEGGPDRWPRWAAGVWYVTAKWGYGEAPDDVKEVCLALTVSIWQAKGQPIIGTEDHQYPLIAGLTKNQKAILRNVKRAYMGVEIA